MIGWKTKSPSKGLSASVDSSSFTRYALSLVVVPSSNNTAPKVSVVPDSKTTCFVMSWK